MKVQDILQHLVFLCSYLATVFNLELCILIPFLKFYILKQSDSSKQFEMEKNIQFAQYMYKFNNIKEFLILMPSSRIILKHGIGFSNKTLVLS